MGLFPSYNKIKVKWIWLFKHFKEELASGSLLTWRESLEMNLKAFWFVLSLDRTFCSLFNCAFLWPWLECIFPTFFIPQPPLCFPLFLILKGVNFVLNSWKERESWLSLTCFSVGKMKFLVTKCNLARLENCVNNSLKTATP